MSRVVLGIDPGCVTAGFAHASPDPGVQLGRLRRASHILILTEFQCLE